MRNRNKETDEQLYERFGNYLERRDVEIRLARLAEEHRQALANPYAHFTHLLPRATWRTNVATERQQESDGALQEGND
jgi:hypothetical protein